MAGPSATFHQGLARSKLLPIAIMSAPPSDPLSGCWIETSYSTRRNSLPRYSVLESFSEFQPRDLQVPCFFELRAHHIWYPNHQASIPLPRIGLENRTSNRLSVRESRESLTMAAATSEKKKVLIRSTAGNVLPVTYLLSQVLSAQLLLAQRQAL